MKGLLIALIILTVSGCTYLTAFETVTKEAVSLYCDAPPTARAINRINANRIIAPNKIEITCVEE